MSVAHNLIGHGAAQQTLVGMTAHSVLLAGPAHVGKRALAHWYAAVVNCQNSASEPCGQCSSCNQNPHPDVLFIEPKTETRSGKSAKQKIIPISTISRKHDIDHEHDTHVLDFLETRAWAKHKIVIVDGAEFLNESSANALLKIVEEPPHGAKFVFLSEEDAAVLPTIRSRSAQLRLSVLSDSVLLSGIKNLKLKIPKEQESELLAFAAGRPGMMIEHASSLAALTLGQELLRAVNGQAIDALTVADRAEKSYERDQRMRELLPLALTFLLRERDPQTRIALDAALARCNEAIESYVSPSLAFAVLALEARRALGLSA